MTRARTLREHVLAAGVADWLGIEPATARVALALFERRTAAAPHIIGHASMTTTGAVRAHVCSLRASLPPAAIETRSGCYAFTDAGRAAITAALDAIRAAVADTSTQEHHL